MIRPTLIASALAIALVGAWPAAPAAQQSDTRDRTFLTFSAAAEMPGLTLQPGTYVFKLADTPSRDVVQVWDGEEKDILGQWLFVRAERPDASDDTVVMFRETSAGATPAVQYWFLPGQRSGKEFVYPKDQAVRIAQRTQQRILASDGDIASNSRVEPIDPSSAGEPAAAPADSPSQTAATPPVTPAAVDPQPADPLPAPAPPARAEAQTPAPAAVPERQIARAETLPETASPLALVGLIGLLSFAGIGVMRALRR